MPTNDRAKGPRPLVTGEQLTSEQQTKELKAQIQSLRTQLSDFQQATRVESEAHLAEINRLQKELDESSAGLRERFHEIAQLTRLLMRKESETGDARETLPFFARAVLRSRLLRRLLKFRRDRLVRSHIRLLEGSDLFDPIWYLQQYPDVERSAIPAELHYLNEGSREGRNPSPFFDTRAYLRRNPDVTAAGVNPLVHYLKTGQFEERDITPVS